jgi:hypothetical protein
MIRTRITKSLLAISLLTICVWVVATFADSSLGPSIHEGPPLPRIRTRTADKTGEFYFVRDGNPRIFKPTGNSWFVLHEEADGDKFPANFSPGYYSSASAEKTLMKMAQSGYNLVRIPIFKGHYRCTDLIAVGGSAKNKTATFHPEFMTNVFDFLELARTHNIYVQIALDGWPWTTYYRDMALTDLPEIAGKNRENMTPGNMESRTSNFIASTRFPGIGTYESVRDVPGWREERKESSLLHKT